MCNSCITSEKIMTFHTEFAQTLLLHHKQVVLYQFHAIAWARSCWTLDRSKQASSVLKAHWVYILWGEKKSKNWQVLAENLLIALHSTFRDWKVVVRSYLPWFSEFSQVKSSNFNKNPSDQESHVRVNCFPMHKFNRKHKLVAWKEFELAENQLQVDWLISFTFNF